LSRRIRAGGGNCCNLNPNLLETSFKYGQRDQLRIAGVPVGREIPGAKVRDDDVGSIIVVVATDAPLVPTQLKRVAKRVTLGLGRDGSYSGDGSGDIFIAFSTANSGAASSPRVQATEEAAINALVLGVSIE
jgi:L-aminopeptidase/D-esterase-like protein